MSDQSTQKGEGIVKPYLGFIDTNVLFKKPISCLFAIVSLLSPVYFLMQIFQYEVLKSGSAKLIIACILVFLFFAFAGVFGALIWWHRRITRDEGPKWYPNFRRFIQTTGECMGTFIAITVFGSVLILMLFFRDEAYLITSFIPLSLPPLEITHALFGPVAGFIIIIVTKILLFLLDPIIWLIKQIWTLFVRIVKYCYRCVINVHGVIEKNTPVWFGFVWLLAVAVVITGVVLCFRAMNLYAALALALGLAFMAFLVYKKKQFDGGA